jgi:hypothetical protein
MKVEVDYQFRNHPEYISVKEIRHFEHDNYPIVVGRIIREINDKGGTLNSIRLLTDPPWIKKESLV